jgi:hypothetical protein
MSHARLMLSQSDPAKRYFETTRSGLHGETNRFDHCSKLSHFSVLVVSNVQGR